MSKIDVSPTPTTRLGELLWLGTHVMVKHPADGAFKCIGSYFLWLKTEHTPQVRFWPFIAGYEEVCRNEPNLDLSAITPEQEQRIATAITMLLEEHQLIQEFKSPAAVLSFHSSVPNWYAQLLLRLQKRLSQ